MTVITVEKGSISILSGGGLAPGVSKYYTIAPKPFGPPLTHTRYYYPGGDLSGTQCSPLLLTLTSPQRLNQVLTPRQEFKLV